MSGFPEFHIRPDGGDGGGLEPPDAGPDDANSEETPPPPDGGDAGPSPVLVGITPTPASDAPDGPTEGQAFAAMLTTVAAGARSAVITRTWSDVAANGVADVVPEIDFFTQHKMRVLFNLAFVDRKRDGRPPDLSGLPWGDPAVREALDAAIDSILNEVGEHLDVLTLGRDVDVFLQAHPEDGDALIGLASHACEHAHASSAAPPGLRLAVAGSFDGIAAEPDALKALAHLGDVIALSYIPGQSGELVAPTTEVANHLDQMIALATEVNKPIVLQAVGYPSDPFMQSSAVKQQLFFEAFFGALLPRRAAFPWVNIHELHDRWPKACASYAEGQGEPADSSTASFACSLGLFTSSGEEKPAWAEVLEGAATFASP